MLAVLSWRAVAQARALEIETPDLARLADGVYTGEWSIPPVTAEVEVTVEDKIITLSTGVTGQSEKRYLVQAVLVSE